MTNAGEDVGERTSYTVSGNVSNASSVEISVEGPQKLKIELSHDPAMPLLGTYPKESKSKCNRDGCTPVFMAALFTIAKL
jgi:hypothetical protein